MSLPCKQSHERMKQRDGGYYCESCEKVLHDFRQKTNEEIHQTITTSPGKVCGIFQSHQISSKISHVALSGASYRVGLSLLGILGFLGPVVTSCESAPGDATVVKQKAFNQLKFPMTISGQLKDEKTGKPLAKSPVEIQQSGKTILKGLTDEHGNFELIVQEKDLKNETFDLIYQAKKHVPDTLSGQRLKSFQKGNKLVLTLKAEAVKCQLKTGEVPIHHITGDVLIEGEVAPQVIQEEPPTPGVPVIENTQKPSTE